MKKIVLNICIALIVVSSMAYGKDVLSSEQPANDIEIITRSGAIIPFQFAIVEQLQLVSKDKSITGLKINFVYGSNYGITGIDLGIISKAQYTTAVQVNLMTIVEQEGVGLQIGLFNLVQSYSGMQLGVFNLCGSTFTGLQAGLFNHASVCSGMQIGLVNNCSAMRGLQIGLINVIKENNFPFMPILNMKF
jgi:hypothetical protein